MSSDENFGAQLSTTALSCLPAGDGRGEWAEMGLIGIEVHQVLTGYLASTKRLDLPIVPIFAQSYVGS